MTYNPIVLKYECENETMLSLLNIKEYKRLRMPEGWVKVGCEKVGENRKISFFMGPTDLKEKAINTLKNFFIDGKGAPFCKNVTVSFMFDYVSENEDEEKIIVKQILKLIEEAQEDIQTIFDE